MNKYLHLLFLLMLASCMGTKVDEKVSSGSINALAPYLWDKSSLPLKLSISKDFLDPDEVDNIIEMSDAWSEAMSGTIFFEHPNKVDGIPKDLTNLNLLNDRVMGIYRMNPWPSSLPSNALAVTQLFGRRYNTGSSSEFVRIEHADILINYGPRKNSGPFSFYSGTGTIPASYYDLRTVILHEMGHFLGLQHNTNVDSYDTVMYPNISTQERKQVPQQVDINDLANKYGIYSLSAGGGSAISGSGPTEYVVDEDQPQEDIKIIIELYPDGECVHRENGVPVERHQVKI